MSRTLIIEGATVCLDSKSIFNDDQAPSHSFYHSLIMTMRWKDEFWDLVFLLKRMALNPLMMVLWSIWIVITGQEKATIKNFKDLAEKDRNKDEQEMPNETIQGTGVAVSCFFV